MDKVTLKIPRPLYEHIKSVIKPSGFSSVNEFVVYVLRDLMARMKDDIYSGELSASEVDRIRSRLKNLGYF
ncbi:CopG family transcriptional regulator [bacterium]|nr:CopG family transcriptional regulator [FCB group bacterium]MBL7191271.1 CopG family transcriptional regulator [bacterium]